MRLWILNLLEAKTEYEVEAAKYDFQPETDLIKNANDNFRACELAGHAPHAFH